MPALDADAIAQLDASNLIGDVLALPEQIEDALWRVDSAGVRAKLEAEPLTGPLFVCGMGGSAIGGDLAEGVLGEQLTRPLHTVRGYSLPAWATPDSTVLCVSYSGNTEEALACFDAAGALGARRIVVSSGGSLAGLARDEDVPVIPLPGVLQPRAAVAYMLVSVLEVAAYVGICPGMRAELDIASSRLKSLATEWSPDAPGDNLAKHVATKLGGHAVCIYGAGPTTAVARRWKTQINENAELPASFGELPEADHNEIVGWGGANTTGKFAAVFLTDSDQHPRVIQRIELTAAAVEAGGFPALTLDSRGDNRVERVLSLVLLGDLVSVYMAVLRGVDPTPVAAIERLKQDLARASVG